MAAAALRSPSAFPTRRPPHFSTLTTRKTLTRPPALPCRCSLSVDTNFLGCDLLGIDSTAGQHQIRAAYRWVQRKWHPDVAGSDGHHMAILLNEAYAGWMESEGFIGRPIYSTWYGPEEERAVFVDEVKCIGCLKCALVATRTFAIETVYGRARAVGQWADDEETVRDAVRVCRGDCISWVERAKLPALEFLMSKQPRVAVNEYQQQCWGQSFQYILLMQRGFWRKLQNRKRLRSSRNHLAKGRQGWQQQSV